MTQWAGQRAVETATEGHKRIQLVGMRSHTHVFPVSEPVTVFVRGSRCRVAIQYHELDQVELHAQFYYAFGLQFVVEQDDAGIYVVAKRRRILGAFSRAEFILRVPQYTHLALQLTPGHIRLDEVDGIVEFPPLKHDIPYRTVELTKDV